MGSRSILRLVFLVWILVALLPLLAMLQRSLMPDGHITVSAYTHLFASAREWILLRDTLLLAGVTSILAGLIGLPLSVLLARTDLPGRRALFALFVAPILLPPSVLAYGWFALLGREGLLGGILGLSGGKFLFSPAGCLIVLVASFLPVVLLFSAASLLAANPRLEEVARLSARPSMVLLRITIPQVLPALAMGVLLVFCLALGETGAPTFLRVNVYAVESLTQFAAFYDFSSATAAACPLLLVVLLAFWGLHLLGVRPGAVLQPPSTGRAPEPFHVGRSDVRLAVLVGALWMVLA
ncbi:MAG: ABC transporter permease subunit, partial [Acidobacteria bacterium]|nr:ABC transporter permease subunit [Acidobacteriota bacterium]